MLRELLPDDCIERLAKQHPWQQRVCVPRGLGLLEVVVLRPPQSSGPIGGARGGSGHDNAHVLEHRAYVPPKEVELRASGEEQGKHFLSSREGRRMDHSMGGVGAVTVR